MKSTLRIAVALVITATTTSAQPPETGQPGASEVFAETLDVRVINVPTYVRDGQGRPIRGLTKDDFELFEDGKRVPISNFYEVVGGERQETAAAPEPPRAEVGGELPQPSLLRPDPLTIVLFVDHFNARPTDRNRALREVRAFLREAVQPGDQLMVASYNRVLKIEQTLTDDLSRVSRALLEAEKRTGERTSLDTELRDMFIQLEEARDPGWALGRAQLYAQAVRNDLQFSLDGLQELVTALAGLPGRKAIVHVSSGLPFRPGQEAFQMAAERFPEDFVDFQGDLLRYDLTQRYQVIAQTANASGAAFYTIDGSGAGGQFDNTSAEFRGSAFASASQVNAAVRDNFQSSINFLAADTGGQAILNTSNFDDNLLRFNYDFRDYYALGYSPGHGGAGRAHRIEVKLRKGAAKGAKVRHRRHYRDKPVEEEMEDQVVAMLRFGHSDNLFDLGLTVGSETPIDRRSVRLNLEVRLPIGAFSLLPRPDGSHQASVRLWLSVGDARGTAPVQVHEVPIEIPPGDLERARRSYYVQEIPVTLERGEQQLAIVARDDLAAKSGGLLVRLEVGG